MAASASPPPGVCHRSSSLWCVAPPPPPHPSIHRLCPSPPPQALRGARHARPQPQLSVFAPSAPVCPRVHVRLSPLFPPLQQLSVFGVYQGELLALDWRRHLTRKVCGCVGVWVCGCVGVWVCGCVGVWVCGCVGVWVCGCVGVWVCGCVGAREAAQACKGGAAGLCETRRVACIACNA
jgi:hypothetical protein